MNKQNLASQSPGKLLVICGPTSTGKTSLAIDIAKKFNGELVSADSRQVYKMMNVGTGKDIPQDSRFKIPDSKLGGYYEVDGVKVWGYDLVDPRHEFSVAQYLKIAHYIIDDISKRRKLPILVGGTGLYIKGVIDGIGTADVPKNNKLRKNLEGKSVDELYENLSQLDSLKAGSLNSSDKRNPRRLIRAIEIAQYQLTKKTKTQAHHTIGSNFNVIYIGLTAPKEFIDRRIVKRIIDRVDKGVKSEIENLLKNGVTWDKQAMMAMGYGLWRDYFEGEVSEDTILAEWARDEVQYAKRQMVWFKKDDRIRWFDITDPEYPINVENLIQKWYNQP